MHPMTGTFLEFVTYLLNLGELYQGAFSSAFIMFIESVCCCVARGFLVLWLKMAGSSQQVFLLEYLVYHPPMSTCTCSYISHSSGYQM